MNRWFVFVLMFFLTQVKAQEFPARPITVIVPFSAGSASDVIARIVLERMGTSMGRRFVVDNRPAAGGIVGTLAASKAEPDGYTLLMGASGPMVANKVLNPNVGFDPEKDFQPISTLADIPDMSLTENRQRVIGWALNPGDLVAFHMLTLHSASGSATRRRVFSARYLGDDMVHAPRAWRTSPEFTGLQDELPAQMPMKHRLFPMVFPHQLD